ncbi:MAG: DNA polymerase I [Syntrophus sp. PtaB.Bin075]|nr:MAG: DNA polymerase I [Syntrophus sp. PtaB.Bin075]
MSTGDNTENSEKSTIYLVDGSNYLYRAFYAIRELSNSRGLPTNAVYGFTNMLIKLLRERKPEYIAITFDLKGPTFRHETYAQYKATRKATPEALIPQIPYIKDIIRGFSIPILEQQGTEADDIIGTLACRFAGEGLKVVIVSGDKDMLQLLSPDVIMIDTMNDRTYDVAAVRERFGVDPEKVPEILGLTGDMSDNIPGIPGIGPKGALRLIEEYGSIEEILRNVERLRNPKLRDSVRVYGEQALLSRDLARIRTGIPLTFDLEEARLQEPDREVLTRLFRELEFSSLLQEFSVVEDCGDNSHTLLRTPEAVAAFMEPLKEGGFLVLEMVISSSEPMRAELIGVALGLDSGNAGYIPLEPGAAEKSASSLSEEQVFPVLFPFLADKKIALVGHDLKTVLIVLSQKGVKVQNPLLDTMVAAYILNPARRGYELSEIVQDYLHRQVEPLRKKLVGGSSPKQSPASFPPERLRDFACRRVEAIGELASTLIEKMEETGLRELFDSVEMPLVAVLAAMEEKGVLLDLHLLKEMSQELGHLLSLSEAKIYALAGERFNIASPKQLQTILFEKLNLPKGKKTKGGYSTDVEVLSNLALNHELPAEILAYRSMAKLKSTYIDALPSLINIRTGRIHTSYNQTVAATGRLSSSNPNLQNIPIRTLEGKRIRQAFIAPPGWAIVSADYSQIELRVLAHLSEDPVLINAFAAGEDIHSRTAADVFGVFPEMINAEMRRQAKVINFGVLYGMSAFGLSRELGIPQKQAQAYIDGYFKKYESVKTYLDGILQQARERGYVTTLLNRRRYLPEINSVNPAVRQLAERMAINAPIQGTAADLIKMAMLRIADLIREKGMKSAMTMQVHDELVFEVPQEEKIALMNLVRQEMEGVVELKVPLKVDIASGRNWDEAHS